MIQHCFIKTRNRAFSLVELLITVAIMGILASFTIPAIVNQSNTPTGSLGAKQTAGARNAAFMILAAYEQYKAANGTVPSTMSAVDLKPYLNYVSEQTSSSIDAHPISNLVVCTVGEPCLKLHNGAILMLRSAQFAGTNTTNTIRFFYDPDGVYSGTGVADNASKSLFINLYYDGVIRSRGNVRLNTCDSFLCDPVAYAGGAGLDPSWFLGF